MDIVVKLHELQHLMSLPRKVEDLESTVKSLRDQNAALLNLYSELLEKVTDLNRYV